MKVHSFTKISRLVTQKIGYLMWVMKFAQPNSQLVENTHKPNGETYVNNCSKLSTLTLHLYSKILTTLDHSPLIKKNQKYTYSSWTLWFHMYVLLFIRSPVFIKYNSKERYTMTNRESSLFEIKLFLEKKHYWFRDLELYTSTSRII